MLPEIGATELLVIAAVALIVVGPKDLPILLRKLGQFMGKVRSMAADFRASFDEMARQSELDELRAEVEAMRKGQLADMAALQAGDAQVTQVFHEIDQGLSADAVRFPPNLSVDPDGMAPATEAAAEPAVKPRARRAAPAKAESSGGGAVASKPKAAKPRKPAAANAAAAKPRPRKGGGSV